MHFLMAMSSAEQYDERKRDWPSRRAEPAKGTRHRLCGNHSMARKRQGGSRPPLEPLNLPVLKDEKSKVIAKIITYRSQGEGT
jgi:hypothetical protein